MSVSRVTATKRKSARLLAQAVEEEEEKLLVNEVAADKRRNVASSAVGGLSELEQRRLKNIEENAKFLAELQVDELKVTSSSLPLSKQATRPRNFRKTLHVLSEPMSLRSRAKSAGSSEPTTTYESSAPVDQYQRKPVGQLQLNDYWLNKDLSESELDVPILPPSALVPSEAMVSHKIRQISLSSLASGLGKIALTENHVCKVVRSRICSLAVHPGLNESPIVAAADKEGQVGLWRVGSADGPQTFDIHSSAVYGLQFRLTDPAHLYSCSYDGSLRCCHLETAVCHELYRTDEASETRLSFFDFETPHTTLVAQSNGNVLRVDERERAKVSAELCLGEGPLKTVHVHPQRREIFATASSTALVQIWDSRSLGSGRPRSIATLPSSRVVHSAFFSPVTGHKLLSTSADDTLKLYDTASLSDVKLVRTIGHNNRTGRWLTAFKATWHPHTDDLFVVGSMNSPRRIEVYNGNADIVRLIYSDWLSSVCSINVFHPTMNILIGGNSSGRAHVFMSP